MVRVHDTDKDPRYIKSHDDIRSEVAVPLILQDRVVGVMDLESDRVGHFTDDHVRTLSVIAPQVASSVENARLYGDLRGTRSVQHHGVRRPNGLRDEGEVTALSRGQEWKVLITGFAGLLSAGAWAQWVEASSRLRRPFGFYGGLIGVGLACLLFKERRILLAAHCLGAPWMQGIGRFHWGLHLYQWLALRRKHC